MRECEQMTDQDTRAVQRVLNYSYPAGINQAIYPGIKLSCSKPHELIPAWDKSSTIRDSFIPAI